MVKNRKKPPKHPIPAAHLEPLMFKPDAEVHGRVGGKVDELVHGGGVKALVVDVEAEKPSREVVTKSSQVFLQK